MLEELRLLLGDRYTDDATGKQQQQKEKSLVYVESKRISDKNSARLCCTARRRVCLVA
jgi:hypothetical protein